MLVLKILAIAFTAIVAINATHCNLFAIGEEKEWDTPQSEKRHYIFTPVAVLLWFAIAFIECY
jgi:hypothetical protein